MKRIDWSNPLAGAPIILRNEVDSTMTEAKRMVNAKAENAPGMHGTVILAEHQTAGRCRGTGRRWISYPGENLLFTIILEEKKCPDALPPIPLLTGLFLSRALESRYSMDSHIKWPNDLLVNGKKIAGILCEKNEEYYYIGVGVNCNQRDFSFPCRYPPTSIMLETGRKVHRLDFLKAFLEEFALGLSEDSSVGEGGTSWISMLEQRLFPEKGEIEIQTGEPGKGPIVRGHIVGIGEDGGLLLRLRSGLLKSVISGEIVSKES